ncbi:hypothetical protein A6V39_05295 [Candidatus Mycoplasma haematobovis]|uniref:Uncharacterized protein n=1 Tax=Candidatus Mycoplasma haematobovis TaxID=432608 RepID=A0A1A9QDG9_9MOLU|nr:hypothetical protein [Candidatus Mycoplasma haematobovis]OAL09750.1 hypothetical protein A6V39_05295 [Candidatus Mycoplasma haematobovis]
MNKKLILSLLGGGVTSLIASFTGLTLNDNISYKKKTSRFKKVNETFSKSLTGQFENYYLPSWDNDAIWKRMHDFLRDRWTHSNPYEKYPTFQSLRDYCYEMAEKDKNNGDCNGTWGWCDDCIRDRSWDNRVTQ